MSTTVFGASGVRPTLPPGPRLPAVVQMLHLGFRPMPFLEACARRFGDGFTVRVPTLPPQVFFHSPESIREIFAADGKTVHAGRANQILAGLLGTNSLLVLDGERHLHERRLMLPPFHGERMRVYAELIGEAADRAIDSWPIGRPFPVHSEMQRVTLDVILRAVFGVDERDTDFERVRDLLARVMEAAASPALLLRPLRLDLGPRSPWGRIVRIRREVHELLQAAIHRRRTENRHDRIDVLSMIVAARDENGDPMGDAEIRDQMMTLLLAGHETTATSLAWGLYHLLRRPETFESLRREVDAVVGDGPVTAELLGKLELLDATVKETLRLRPVVPDVGRWLEQPTRIGARELPADVVAVPSIYLAHRRPEIWPEPEVFRPERFLGLRPSPWEFLPFGGGIRRCLGAAFATFEMKIVLARIARRATLRLAATRIVARRRSVTLAPSPGVPVVLEERAPA